MWKKKQSLLWVIAFAVPFIGYVDFWQWHKVEPLIFGWIPWHVFYQILVNLLLTVVYTSFAIYRWPKQKD